MVQIIRDYLRSKENTIRMISFVILKVYVERIAAVV
jgi:hypothetical protein